MIAPPDKHGVDDGPDNHRGSRHIAIRNERHAEDDETDYEDVPNTDNISFIKIRRDIP